MFLKWPISIIGKMLNIGADNRSTPSHLYCHLTQHCPDKPQLCSVLPGRDYTGPQNPF